MHAEIASHDFDAHLSEQWGLDLADEASRTRFVVDSDARAEWALRKRAWYVRRMAERAASVAEQIEDLHVWQDQQEAQDQREVAYFEGLLAAYYDCLNATDRLGRKTGYALSGGVLRRRTTGVSWQVKDEAPFVEWATAKQLIRTKTEVAWRDLKRRLQPVADQVGAEAIDRVNGEVIPGLIVGAPSQLRFVVEAR